MKKKVVDGFDILFKDDFSIMESEITGNLPLPKSYLFSNDEMLIVYNDSLLRLSEKKTNDYLKFYKSSYGLEKISTVKEMEEAYFKDNANLIGKIKKDFIEKCVVIPAYLKSKVPNIGKQIGKEITKKIGDSYPPVDRSRSMFSQINPKDMVLLDNKTYKMLTVAKFLEKWEKSFEPQFFKELIQKSQSAHPKEVSEMMVSNKGKIHEVAMPIIRDKIWCNDKSMELCIDGKYYVPDYRGRSDKLEAAYMKIIEGYVKMDAAHEMQKVVS